MATDAKPAAKGRLIPAIMMGSLILVVLASTLLFRAAVKGDIDLPALLGTKNNGELIRPPRAIAELPLQSGSGERFDFAKQPKQWSVVIPVASHCDDKCQQMLYLTRQIHIALGKHTERVRRYLIVTESPLDAEFENLLKQHPKLEILYANNADFATYFASSKLQPVQNHQYLLLDPEGWFMMVYGLDIDGKAVLKDLKFLLTNSHENEAKI